MNDKQWDAKLKVWLKKTGADVRRAGQDIRVEAEKLLAEVKDPERQAKVKEGLKDFGGWARKTAEELAELVETGVKKAEGALTQASDKVVDFTTGAPAPSATPPSPPPVMDTAPAAPPSPAKKSIGGAKKKKPAAAAAKPTAKKPLGRKGES
jgi:hypothetical protein